MEKVGFLLYLLFTASWFLRFTVRLPALGVIRFDLLLVLAIVFIYFTSSKKIEFSHNPIYKKLNWLILAIIFATPFAEWPGTVLRFGIQNFIKAIVFFFFTIWFVTTEKRLKIFVFTFVLCQSFRVLEPLYLHVTQGYWGSMAALGDWDYMNRLAGAPADVINPNGLAFVILTIIPFFIVFFKENFLWKIFSLMVAPLSLYALYLTGSRSGVVGLVVIFLFFIYQEKNRLIIAVVLILASIFFISKMEGDFRDRYLSIISSDTANASTAKGRIEGIFNDFKVGMRRPIFGHGLGTSLEANANFGGKAQISHNVYAETFQEIGIFGLIFFVSFIWSIFISNLNIVKSDKRNDFLFKLSCAVFIFAGMNIFFGLASYGLSSYEWYFLGGLSVIIPYLLTGC